MKRYTSKFLKAVALAYMGFPMVYLIVAAILFDIPANQCVRILLAPSYYLLSLMAVAAGYGLWEMRRWGWYVFIPTNIAMAYANALLVFDYGASHYKVVAYIISLLVLGITTYRVTREVRVPYFLPKIRWWESNPRYRLSVPVSLLRESGAPLEGEILDLSMGGCFIKIREDLKPDESISLHFTVFGQPIQCVGTVVWRTQSTVTHPKGVGVKFRPLARPLRRTMRAVTSRLKEIASLYRSSRFLMNQEEFHRRMEELQTSKVQLPGEKTEAGA